MGSKYLIMAVTSVLLLGCGDKKEAEIANQRLNTPVGNPINHPLANALSDAPLFTQQKALLAANILKVVNSMNRFRMTTAKVQSLTNCFYTVMSPLAETDVTTLANNEGIGLTATPTLASLNTCFTSNLPTNQTLDFTVTRANTIDGNQLIDLGILNSGSTTNLTSRRKDHSSASIGRLIIPESVSTACRTDNRLQKTSLITRTNSMMRMNGVSGEFNPDPENFIVDVYAFWSETCSFIGVLTEDNISI